MKAKSSRNQRVSNPRQRKQQHLLEVTIRHDKAVAMRNRTVFFFFLKTVLLVGALGGLYVGGKEGLRRFLWENPDYMLTDVHVTTDGSLTREQVLVAGNIVEGRNIFMLDLAKAQQSISALAQVERAEIQRVLPNRLIIGISERRPIAWLTARAQDDPTSSDKSFLIDARGIVMRSKTVLADYLHLPVISGIAIENMAPGQRVQSFEMQSALELVRLNVDSTGFQARNIDLSKGYCLVVTDRTRAKITFGLDRVDLQLDRLNRLLEHFQSSHRELQTVNLLVERNVPVTFVDPDATPPESEFTAPKPEPGRIEKPGSKPPMVLKAQPSHVPAVAVKPAVRASASAEKSSVSKPVSKPRMASVSPRPTNGVKSSAVRSAQPGPQNTPQTTPQSAPVPDERKIRPGFLRKPFRLND